MHTCHTHTCSNFGMLLSRGFGAWRGILSKQFGPRRLQAKTFFFCLSNPMLQTKCASCWQKTTFTVHDIEHKAHSEKTSGTTGVVACGESKQHTAPQAREYSSGCNAPRQVNFHNSKSDHLSKEGTRERLPHCPGTRFRREFCLTV